MIRPRAILRGAELFVTLINRLHALPVQAGILRQVRHGHDLWIPLFPVCLIVGVNGFIPGGGFGLSTPAEIWKIVPGPVQVYFAVCLIGCAGCLVSCARYLRHRDAPQQTSFESQVIDVEETLGRTLAGEGRYARMARMPLNECFTIEINEREFTLSGLPPEWNGLRILHLTDLHFTGTVNRDYFEYVFEEVAKQEFDMVCFTGDLLDGNEFSTPSKHCTLGEDIK